MSHEEKVRYIFGIYDFDESGLLSVDEMILALRSSIAGLCKLSGIDAPLEAQIEHIAIGAFDNIKSIDGSMITRDKFVHHCITTPEVVSWIEYYADLDDGADEPSRPGVDKPADKIIASLARAPGRTVRHKAAMDVDGGFAEWAATEKKGLAIDILQPPWRSTVAFTEPEGAAHRADRRARGEPRLEWVYGLNAQRRQNVCSRRPRSCTGERARRVMDRGDAAEVQHHAHRPDRVLQGLVGRRPHRRRDRPVRRQPQDQRVGRRDGRGAQAGGRGRGGLARLLSILSSPCLPLSLQTLGF